MIFKLIIIISVIISIECKKSYVIKGPGWNNEMQKCASGGDDSRTNDYNISSLEPTGFKYEDINLYTTVKAYGNLELRTKATGSEIEENMPLTVFVQENGYKKFTKTWKREATSGWATQTVAIGLTVKIYQEGLIELNNYVYAGSWGSVTCAWAKAYVETIEIIN